MTENFSWSANAGRWMGIPIRIHLFLLLFVAMIFAIEMNYSGTLQRVNPGTAFVTALILLVSIAIHELGHLFAILNLGGHVNRIVLMPWGGNSDSVLPTAPRAHGFIAMAGPFVSGMIFVMGATLLVQSGHAEFSALTNPFRPFEFDLSEWPVSSAKIVTWVNFQLMFVNLIPCFPFDGANLIRALIGSMNYGLPKARVESAIMVMGNAVAFTMIGLSLLIRDYDWGPIRSSWMLMLFGGIVLIFAARYSFHERTKIENDEWEDGADTTYDSYFDENSHSGFDFSSDRENSVYSQWLVEKQEERLQLDMHREEEEDRLADEILKKLHGRGLESLSMEDRSLLDRVSARIRRRRQQGV